MGQAKVKQAVGKAAFEKGERIRLSERTRQRLSDAHSAMVGAKKVAESSYMTAKSFIDNWERECAAVKAAHGIPDNAMIDLDLIEGWLNEKIEPPKLQAVPAAEDVSDEEGPAP